MNLPNPPTTSAGPSVMSPRAGSLRFQFLALAAACFLSLPAAFAGVQTVTTAADSGAGSLRNAVSAAASGDTIDFTGLTGQTITLTSGEIVVNKSLIFSGPGAGQLTISGNDASRVFRVDSGMVVFKDLTIAYGRVTGGNGANGNVGNDSNGGGGAGGGGAAMGAGMLVDFAANVTVQNVVFANNVVQGGTGGGGGGSGSNGAVGGAGKGAASGPSGSVGQNSGCIGSGGAGGTGHGGGGGGGGRGCGAGAVGGVGSYGGGGGGGGGGGSGIPNNPGGGGGSGGIFGGNGASGNGHSIGGGAGGGAGLGAGLFVWQGGTITLSNVTFQNNTATGGPGGNISGRAGSSGQGKGAAIYFHPCANVQVTNLTFSGNSSANGGSTGFAIDGNLKDNANVYGIFNPPVASGPITLRPQADVTSTDGYLEPYGNSTTYPGQVVSTIAYYPEEDYGDGEIYPASSTRTAIKFNLQGVGGVVSNAKLKLHIVQTNGAAELDLWGSVDDSWSESAPSFPATRTINILQNTTSFPVGSWLEIDVTAFIANQAAGDQSATFVLEGSASQYGALYINSSEDCPLRAQLEIATGPVNVVPAFAGVTTTLTLDQDAIATDIKALLHARDSDDGQTLTWSQNAAPTNGTLSFTGATAASGGTNITSGGTITYTPTANYSGPDSFTVQVNDGTATATRTISVTVLDTVAPTVVSITRLTPVQQTVTNSTVTFTATFSENVVGVVPARFAVTPVNTSTTTGTVTTVSGGSKIYDITVNLTGGRGEFRLDVVAP